MIAHMSIEQALRDGEHLCTDLCASSSSSLRQSRPCSLSTSSRGRAAPKGLLRGLGGAGAAWSLVSEVPVPASDDGAFDSAAGGFSVASTAMGSTGLVRGASWRRGRLPDDGAAEPAPMLLLPPPGRPQELVVSARPPEPKSSRLRSVRYYETTLRTANYSTAAYNLNALT